MKKFRLKNKNRFLILFSSFSFIFCIILIPIYIYLQYTFTNLELERNKRHLISGMTKLENLSACVLNFSQSLDNDSRFYSLSYNPLHYQDINVTTITALRDTLRFAFSTQDLIKDSGILWSEGLTVTPTNIYFDNLTTYYPDFFSCEHMDYQEWYRFLSEKGTGFLPVKTVTASNKTYASLIYTTPLNKSSLVYVCIDINNLKKELIPESKADCYLSVYNVNKELLYSDFPEDSPKCKTIIETNSITGLYIEIHIPTKVFSANMRPLYAFLALYAVAYFVILCYFVFMGIRVSKRPFQRLINILHESENLNFMFSHSQNEMPFNPDIGYIENSILQADKKLSSYKNTINEQYEILKTQIFEKAISGSLITENDFLQFKKYFADFPGNYRLVLFSLQSNSTQLEKYLAKPVTYLQLFLKGTIFPAHIQQLNASELLLLLSDTQFHDNEDALEYLVQNVNEHEPTLSLSCKASNSFTTPEELPSAYRQLQILTCTSYSKSNHRICTLDDTFQEASSSFIMSDFQTLINAILFGNHSMAKIKLHECCEHAESFKTLSSDRNIFNLISSMLICIQMEHPEVVLTEYIPYYNLSVSLEEQLSPIIMIFCDKFSEVQPKGQDSLTYRLLQYIEEHFTEPDLCLTQIEDVFQYSVTKIQKLIKDATGMTTANYINKKRMDLAVRLLTQNEKNINEIAKECGFTNTNSFYKSFKRTFGRTPSENRSN